jgi:hypothetical protein
MEILFWAEARRVGLQDREFQLLEHYPYIHSNLQLTLPKRTTHLSRLEDLLLVFPSLSFWEGRDMFLYSPLGHSKLSKALIRTIHPRGYPNEYPVLSLIHHPPHLKYPVMNSEE